MNTVGNAKRARGAILTRSTGQRAKENSGLTSPNCTTFHNDLSSLLDQALHRFEHYSDLARIYAAEAEKHKAILSSLQSLIPPGKRGRGGAA